MVPLLLSLHGRCGRRKDAGALLGTCAPLAAEAKKREDEDAKQGGTKRTGRRRPRCTAPMCMHPLNGQLTCTDGCLAPFRKHVELLAGVESPSASL
jgi:hypothetical protein